MGLDPSLIDRAARTVALDAEPSGVERLLGGPLRYRIDTELPVGLTPELAARLLAVVRTEAERQGEGDADRAGMSWHTVGEGSQIFVNATAGSSGTRLRIVADRTPVLAMTGVSTAVGVLMSGVAVLAAGKLGAYESGLAGLTLFGGSGTAMLALARALWVSSGRALKRKVADLHDAVEHAVADSGPEA